MQHKTAARLCGGFSFTRNESARFHRQKRARIPWCENARDCRRTGFSPFCGIRPRGMDISPKNFPEGRKNSCVCALQPVRFYGKLVGVQGQMTMGGGRNGQRNQVLYCSGGRPAGDFCEGGGSQAHDSDWRGKHGGRRHTDGGHQPQRVL
ncbi:hypothetical protein SDC9_187203 [bioreactor metagenome]|uniref:Uncharacterized protein n=1 Tax=bioreactor metagenome TaxID=1076179 RepID=A0A645HKX6_9ZZZZ